MWRSKWFFINPSLDTDTTSRPMNRRPGTMTSLPALLRQWHQATCSANTSLSLSRMVDCLSILCKSLSQPSLLCSWLSTEQFMYLPWRFLETWLCIWAWLDWNALQPLELSSANRFAFNGPIIASSAATPRRQGERRTYHRRVGGAWMKSNGSGPSIAETFIWDLTFLSTIQFISNREASNERDCNRGSRTVEHYRRDEYGDRNRLHGRTRRHSQSREGCWRTGQSAIRHSLQFLGLQGSACTNSSTLSLKWLFISNSASRTCSLTLFRFQYQGMVMWQSIYRYMPLLWTIKKDHDASIVNSRR